jgi:hypothetical protein
MISYGYHLSDSWVREKVLEDGPMDDNDTPRHRDVLTTLPKQTIINDTRNVWRRKMT